MKLHDVAGLRPNVVLTKLIKRRQVQLDCVNFTALNRWQVFKPAHVIAGHPAILQRCGVVGGTPRAVGAQQAFNREFGEKLIITVQEAA